MKWIFSLTFLIIAAMNVTAQTQYSAPLSMYAKEWNDPKYKVCNTAEHTKYLTDAEKQIVYILNLARMNPKLFCRTVLRHAYTITSFVDTTSEVYYRSLVKEMSAMEPLKILIPDSLCYVSANCHAVSAGKKGYVGHDRQSTECRKKQHYFGECCDFGESVPLEIIITLLIDQGTESLGHRYICLGSYSKMSPAMAPHKTYGTIVVMDFY